MPTELQNYLDDFEDRTGIADLHSDDSGWRVLVWDRSGMEIEMRVMDNTGGRILAVEWKVACPDHINPRVIVKELLDRGEHPTLVGAVVDEYGDSYVRGRSSDPHQCEADAIAVARRLGAREAAHALSVLSRADQEGLHDALALADDIGTLPEIVARHMKEVLEQICHAVSADGLAEMLSSPDEDVRQAAFDLASVADAEHLGVGKRSEGVDRGRS